MSPLNLYDTPAKLQMILADLQIGEELIINADGRPVAKIVKLSPDLWPCEPGTAKDTDHWMAPDFNAPMEEFKEYAE